jgi:hypothetical protein
MIDLEHRLQLTGLIQHLEALVDEQSDTSPQCVDNLVVLGRRLAPSTVPPVLLRFNAESGPMEPMPQRFRVPFPTVDDLRLSVLQKHVNVVRPVKPIRDEEYADDF